MAKSKLITVENLAITVYEQNSRDYISLTDMARYRDAERSDYILQNWMRNRDTIEFNGLWELFNNPDFNSIEFDGIKKMAGSNSFSLTPKRWMAATNVVAAPKQAEFRWIYLPMLEGHTGHPVDISAKCRRAQWTSGGCICKMRKGTPDIRWTYLQIAEGHAGHPVDISANCGRARRTSGGCICKMRKATPDIRWIHLQNAEGHTGVPVRACSNSPRAHRSSGGGMYQFHKGTPEFRWNKKSPGCNNRGQKSCTGYISL